MSTRLGSSLLVGAAIVKSYVVLVIGSMVPAFFAQTYQVRTLAEMDIYIPSVTQFASRFAWVFALSLVLLTTAVLTLLRRCPARYPRLLAMGLSSQGLVLWLAMFCFCFEVFRGPMSMHHGPRFEFSQFFQFAFGVFPVTLCAILWPGLVALFAPEDGFFDDTTRN